MKRSPKWVNSFVDWHNVPTRQFTRRDVMAPRSREDEIGTSSRLTTERKKGTLPKMSDRIMTAPRVAAQAKAEIHCFT